MEIISQSRKFDLRWLWAALSLSTVSSSADVWKSAYNNVKWAQKKEIASFTSARYFHFARTFRFFWGFLNAEHYTQFCNDTKAFHITHRRRSWTLNKKKHWLETAAVKRRWKFQLTMKVSRVQINVRHKLFPHMNLSTHQEQLLQPAVAVAGAKKGVE